MIHSAARDFWRFEDDLAYYRIVQADALDLYSRELFVRRFSTWQLAVGGVVVSKQPLQLDSTGNAAESRCPAWSRIRATVESLVIRALATARHLTDSQKKFLGIRFRSLAEGALDSSVWMSVKLLTDPWGNHLPLSALAGYRRFAHIREPGTPACAAYGRHGTFMVTHALLDRFGMDSLRDWLLLLAEAGLLAEGYSVIESGSLEREVVA
ncbi:MAG: hypothetical protein ACREFT_12710 [Acetobacteraceae bacterium]